MITIVILIAIFSAFIILLISKLGWREKVQTYGPAFLSKMFNCDFCLSFWIGLILTIILFILIGGEWYMLLCPVFSSPITRKLL